MPIMHGKSKESFDHNLKAEMKAGKPLDQSLAIAYAVKKRAQKRKMAEGGMVNEMLNPEHEDKDNNASMVQSTQRLGYKAQEYEDLPHPSEPKRHIIPHMHDGGIIDEIMKRRMGKDGEAADLRESYAKEDFLSEDMAPTDWGGDSILPGQEDDEDPKARRRKMLADIMADLKSQHYGEE